MSENRRSVFKGLFGGAIAAALPQEAKAARQIPEDYEIDFELLTPWANLHWDEEDKTSYGFTLKIRVSDGVEKGEYSEDVYCPYEGKIRWWILPHIDAPLDSAYATGIADSVRDNDGYHDDEGTVRVVFV